MLHALTDALLGTIGDGDIGQHFPPSDPKWKGAASRLFLEDAARRVTALGGRIGNVDITVLAEAPRVGPHRAAMQALIGDVLGLGRPRRYQGDDDGGPWDSWAVAKALRRWRSATVPASGRHWDESAESKPARPRPKLTAP